MRACNRCGQDYLTLHTCAHPLHVALDEACVYHPPGGAVSDDSLRCDVCGPARQILAEGIGSL